MFLLVVWWEEQLGTTLKPDYMSQSRTQVRSLHHLIDPIVSKSDLILTEEMIMLKLTFPTKPVKLHH